MPDAKYLKPMIEARGHPSPSDCVHKAVPVGTNSYSEDTLCRTGAYNIYMTKFDDLVTCVLCKDLTKKSPPIA